jgi:CBS-domain-containing membrane protein
MLILNSEAFSFTVLSKNLSIKKVNWKKYTRPRNIQPKKKKTPWPESTNELYRPCDRRLSAKLVPTFADIGSHMVSAMNPYGRILGFLDQSRYFFLKAAPRL